MITKRTADTVDDYSALFADATNFLREKGLWTATENISTLQEYFFNLKSLLNPNGDGTGGDFKYAILPLNEPYFEIDANSRVITIPSEFRKNGVGVQGDHSAEILFFKIDRFFDAVDFGGTDINIVVQWETSDGATGVSPVFRPNVEDNPDEVRFGWELISDITKAGAVKFSIRILKWNGDGTIAYSFSTLAATIAINQSLQFKADSLHTDYDVNASILNRITNSPSPSAIFKLNTPVWVIPIEPSSVNDEGGENNPKIINFTYNAEAQQYEDEYLKVLARPDLEGGIQYYWYRNGAIDQEGVKNDEPIKVNTKTDSLDINTVYYEDETFTAIYPIEGTPTTFPDDAPETLYRKGGKKLLTKTGIYTVSAEARANSMGSNLAESKFFWKVPDPEDIVLDTTDSTQIILSLSNEQYANTIAPVIKNKENYNYLTYAWTKDEVEKGNGAELNLGIAETSDVSDLKAIQGEYLFTINGTLNRATSENSARKYIVTLPAMRPDLTGTKTSINLNDSVTISRNYNNDYQLAEYKQETFKWYKIKYDANTITAWKGQASAGNFIPNDENSTEIVVSDETNATFTPTEKAYYCCMVTNIYNGDSITLSTPLIEVG